MDKLSFLKSTK